MKYTHAQAREVCSDGCFITETGKSCGMCTYLHTHTIQSRVHTYIHPSLICIHVYSPAIHVYGTDQRPWWATSNQILINHLATTWTWRHINSVTSPLAPQCSAVFAPGGPVSLYPRRWSRRPLTSIFWSHTAVLTRTWKYHLIWWDFMRNCPRQ